MSSGQFLEGNINIIHNGGYDANAQVLNAYNFCLS